jgi:hypothetical protein
MSREDTLAEFAGIPLGLVTTAAVVDLEKVAEQAGPAAMPVGIRTIRAVEIAKMKAEVVVRPAPVGVAIRRVVAEVAMMLAMVRRRVAVQPAEAEGGGAPAGAEIELIPMVAVALREAAVVEIEWPPIAVAPLPGKAAGLVPAAVLAATASSSVPPSTARSLARDSVGMPRMGRVGSDLRAVARSGERGARRPLCAAAPVAGMRRRACAASFVVYESSVAAAGPRWQWAGRRPGTAAAPRSRVAEARAAIS